jgi:hypothetical protein
LQLARSDQGYSVAQDVAPLEEPQVPLREGERLLDAYDEIDAEARSNRHSSMVPSSV